MSQPIRFRYLIHMQPPIVCWFALYKRSNTFLEIDYEIISMVILLFPLIQEGFASFTSESMCRKYRYG